MQTRYAPLTILAGRNVSDSIILAFGETVLGVEIDSAWTAADIQLQISRDTTVLVQNLITNGGFETNTTGWTTTATNTIAASATQAEFGAKSCLVTVGDNAAYMDYSAAPIANAPHTVSAYVFIPTAYDGGGIALKQVNYTVAASQTQANMALRDVWQRLTLTFTPGVDVTGNIQIIGTGAAATPALTINVDGVQLELGSSATTYIDTDGRVSPSEWLTLFDNAGSLSANTVKVVNPAASTLHYFGTNALPSALMFIPLGGVALRLHSVTTTALTNANQAAERALQLLIGTAT